MVRRDASHAGSWYSDDESTLSQQLDQWLSQVPDSINSVGDLPIRGARVIIAPHAGYAYSGAAAAWAYKSLDLSQAKRIFLLGPSHHFNLSTCALSKCSSYSTPLGSLSLDHATISELHATGKFDQMSRSVDEAEHSLEMHLPYIHKILSKSFPHPTTFPPLIPILVGSTSSQTERHYGRILAPYLSDPSSIFIISSDFCHWGLRFNYTYYLPTTTTSSSSTSSSTNTTPTINTPSLPQGRSLRSKDPPPTTPSIHESISHLDHLCMSAITSGSHGEFSRVLRETGNTVCGRHPIGVVMAAMEVLREEEERMEKEDVAGGAEEGKKGRFRFVRYERSSDCVKVGDSSVSYASGFAVL